MLHCPVCLANGIYSSLDIEITETASATIFARKENEKLNCPEVTLKILSKTSMYKMEISCPKRCQSSFYKLKTGSYVVKNADNTFSAVFPNYAEAVTDEVKYKVNREKWIKPTLYGQESWRRQEAWNFGRHSYEVPLKNFELVRYEKETAQNESETAEEIVDDYGYYY